MIRSLVLSFVLLAPSAMAQGGFVTFTSQSSVLGVRSLSMGQSGAFLSDTDPLAFVQNPARLAAAGGAPMLRVSFDGHPNYRSFFSSDYDAGLGYLAATYSVGPGAIGVVVSGLSNTFEAVDDQGNPAGSAKSGDQSVGLGGALRIGDARAHLDVGATARLTRLYEDGFLSVEGSGDVSVTEPSLDLGAIATVNVIPRRDLSTGDFAPTVALSAGYTQRSIGRDFDIGDDDDRPRLVPQDRSGSAGVSAQLGLDARYAGGRIRLVGLDIAAEALAALNEADFNTGTEMFDVDRSSLFGQMRVQDALLGTSSGQTVEGQRGARLTLAEAVWVAVGQNELDFGSNGSESLTWGVGASVGGALRAIGAIQNDAGATALGQRFDFTLQFARSGRYSTRDGEREEDPFFNQRLLSASVAARL